MSYMLPRTIGLPHGVSIMVDQICAVELERDTGYVLAVMSSGDKYRTGETYCQFMDRIDAHVKEWEEIKGGR